MLTSKKVLESWKLDLLADYRLAPLLEKHFDKTSYLSDLLTENLATFSELYAKLTSIKQNLVNIFNEKLSENHELITKDLEDLEAFQLNLQDLKQSEKKVKSKALMLNKDFSQEYENLNKNLPLLEKVYEVSKLSRHSCRFLQNVRLLRSLIVNGEIIDLKKGSLIINELFQLAKTMDLSGLVFYENEKEFINNTRESLIIKTQKRLLANLQARQEEEIKVCLKTLQNLNILADIITQTGTNFLKNIMNIWKSFLIKEYDQNTVLLSFAHELKKVLDECMEISSSVWLLKISLKNQDDLKLTDKNLLNIFELFCNKEVNIIAQSFQKLKENAGKFELNWKVAIRSYPKIFNAFEEFIIKFRENWLLYPDFSEENIGNCQDFAREMMNSISFLRELYHNWLKNELEIRFMGVISVVFQLEAAKNKDYLDNSYQSACKTLNFIQYEFEDNIKTAEIFNKTSDIFLKELKTFLIVLLDKTLKEPFDDVYIGTLFISFNIFAKIGSDSLNLILTNRNNLQLSIEEIDEFMEFYEEALEKLSGRFLEKLFSEIMKIFSLIHENHSKGPKLSFQVFCWESLNFLLTQHNPLKFFNLIERNASFDENWEDFLLIVVNCYGILMSIFNTSSEKFLEIINKDIDVMNALMEKITRKDNNNKIAMIVINIQKLFFLDAANFAILSENNQNFFNFITKDLAIFHFMKRAEREANLKRKNEGFLECLAGVVGGNEVKYGKWKDALIGGGEKNRWKENFDNLKKGGNFNKDNENIKLLEK